MPKKTTQHITLLINKAEKLLKMWKKHNNTNNNNNNNSEELEKVVELGGVCEQMMESLENVWGLVETGEIDEEKDGEKVVLLLTK